MRAYVAGGQASEHAANEEPELAARTICTTLRAFDTVSLPESKHVRVVLLDLVARLTRREISEQAFFVIEETLLELARAESQAWTGSTTMLWKRLFQPAQPIPQSWSARLRRLDGRLGDTHEVNRTLAVAALHEGLRIYDFDSPSEEIVSKKAQLWNRLLDACRDSAESVAHWARLSVVLNLEGGLLLRCLDDERFDRISAMLPTWTALERQALANSLRNANQAEFEDDDRARLDALAEALVPIDLQERLIAQVQYLRPAMADRQSRARDLELAAELLTRADLLPWAIDWLESAEAIRGQPFWRALGRADTTRSLQDRLVTRLRAGKPTTTLANYLIGWAEHGGSGVVEEWLDGTIDGDTLAEVSIRFYTAQMPTDSGWLRILRLVAQYQTSPAALAPLLQLPWSSSSIVHMAELLAQIEAQPDMAPLVLSGSVALLERETEASQQERLVAMMQSAALTCISQRVVIGLQRHVRRAIVQLTELDDSLRRWICSCECGPPATVSRPTTVSPARSWPSYSTGGSVIV
ncbi:MAG: hypothetical protein HC927_08175, partial [Deltaproteobacteria bacterium]|nr:hypothetical protein [Deltaproteobacteria bacterium]